MNALRSSFTGVLAHPAMEAFQKEDSSASKAFHKLTDEPHKVNYMKKNIERLIEIIVRGGILGIVSSCIVVGILGSASLQLTGKSVEYDIDKICITIIIIGVAVVMVSGFSSAYTDYLKREEYRSLYFREKRREKWECDNYIEGEQREMVELYVDKGLSRADAETVIKILSKDKSFFVELMMKEELQMMQPDEAASYAKIAAFLFLSTVLLGMIPLLPYLLRWFLNSVEWNVWFTIESLVLESLFLSLTSLFIMGVIKSSFNVTAWWLSGLQLVIQGLLIQSVCFYSTSLLTTYL